LVFVTKYRRGVFTDEILRDCAKIMRDVCDKFGCELREFNGEDDHVRLLVGFPATVQLSRLVNSLKGVCSRHLRRDHADHLNQLLWGGHLSSRSYYCGTAGGAPLSGIANCVQSQCRPS
jgi:putative transposase